jgi:hypothetical protein
MNRKWAFHIVDCAVHSGKDPVTGPVHEPDLVVLERERPDLKILTQSIRTHLEKSLANCDRQRKDEVAVRELAAAVRLSLAFLRTARNCSSDDGQRSALAPLHDALQSLVAELTGETLPASRSIRAEVGVPA